MQDIKNDVSLGKDGKVLKKKSPAPIIIGIVVAILAIAAGLYFGVINSSSGHYRSNIKKAESYFADGDFDSAIKYYTAALQYKPGDIKATSGLVEAYTKSAKSLVKDGKSEKAEKLYEKALKAVNEAISENGSSKELSDLKDDIEEKMEDLEERVSTVSSGNNTAEDDDKEDNTAEDEMAAFLKSIEGDWMCGDSYVGFSADGTVSDWIYGTDIGSTGTINDISYSASDNQYTLNITFKEPDFDSGFYIYDSTCTISGYDDEFSTFLKWEDKVYVRMSDSEMQEVESWTVSFDYLYNLYVEKAHGHCLYEVSVELTDDYSPDGSDSFSGGTTDVSVSGTSKSGLEVSVGTGEAFDATAACTCVTDYDKNLMTAFIFEEGEYRVFEESLWNSSVDIHVYINSVENKDWLNYHYRGPAGGWVYDFGLKNGEIVE